MSKIPDRNPRDAEVDHRRGELRKPGDRATQPEQGGRVASPNPGHVNPLDDEAGRNIPDPLRYHDLPPLGRDRG